MPATITRLSFTKNDRKEKAKTDVWEVWALQTAMHLGQVSWFNHWRKYTFQPAAGFVFDADCLREVATFCELETRQHKTGRRAFKD